VTRARALLFVFVIGLLPAPSRAIAQEADRILVMPFENVTRDSRILWLSEASAVLLADDLNALGASAITRDERRAAFDRLQVPPAAALTDATVIRIGELVGASQVIVGSLRLDGDDLVVEARRIELETAQMQRLSAERGPVRDLFATFWRVARQLVPSTRSSAERESERPPVAAFENYIKGLVAETPATAIAFLVAALQAQPAFALPRLALWELYTNQGEYERALAAVRLVPDRPPLGRRARFMAGLSYLELERYDDAFATFKALADAQASAVVFNNLGVVELRRGDTLQAARPTDHFRRAAETDPTDPDYFFNMGYASWVGGDEHSAIYWLREAVRRNPADGDAHFVLGVALASTGSLAEANRERDLARRLSSTYAEWEKLPGPEQVPVGLERVKHDVELPSAGQRDQRELAAFHFDRARRLYDEKRDRDAVSELDRVLFLDPYHAEAHLLVARIHLRGGRPPEAIEALKISLWSAETAEAHALLAEAYLEERDPASARTEAERALALDPGSVEARRVLDQTIRGGTATVP
jgi:tetratricopeptide (TPR) repeat protein